MNTHDMEERIRAALNAAADEIDGTGLRACPAPTASAMDRTARRGRLLAPLLAAAAVAAVAVGTATVLSRHPGASQRPGSVAASRSASVAPTASPSPSTSAGPQPTRSATSVSPVPKDSSAGPGLNCDFAEFVCPVPSNYVYYQPLWPFPNYAAEQAWQSASRSAGAQPWHLDPAQTALLFTRDYLGFTDITRVTGTAIDDTGAHIGVGYVTPNGSPVHTAAVLHLVRYSRAVADTSAGWEVVGSDDTNFSLERPAYGSSVTSPMTVGGHITGVDENITVFVLPEPANSSSAAGLPAGGQNSPWQLAVPFTQRGVLTIVASTGGHLIQHERFAIQGVHT